MAQRIVLSNDTPLYFRWHHGATEFVDSLQSIPGLELAIVSTGFLERNIAVAKMLRLKDGSSAFDLAKGGVTGRERPFDRASPKDFTIFGPQLDVTRALFIDDLPKTISRPLQKHVLIIHPLEDEMVMHGVYLDSQIAGATSRMNALELQDFKTSLLPSRNQLARARGLLEQTLDVANQAGGPTLAEALFRLQFPDNGLVSSPFFDLKTSPLVHQRTVFPRGSQVMRLRHPSLKLLGWRELLNTAPQECGVLLKKLV